MTQGPNAKRLPVAEIPERVDPLVREGRTVGLQFLFAFAAGGVLAKAARDTHLRWWWLNLPAVLLVGTAGSLVGFGVARVVDTVTEWLSLERYRARARFWLRYVGALFADVIGFNLVASALEGRSLWRGSSRWAWTVGWPLAALLIGANALDAEASQRVAAARGMLISPVTDLRNRRAFDADLALLLREKVPFTFLFGDLDGLKQVNDRHGHGAGDAAVKALARALELQDGHAYHWGGDEFVLLLFGTDRETLVRTARAVFREVRAFGEVRGQVLGVTFGSTFVGSTDGRLGEDITAAADAALYQAKRAGRGKLVASGESEVALS